MSVQEAPASMTGMQSYRDPRTGAPLTRVPGRDVLRAPDGREYPIVNGIPRFIASADYVSSFGLEWTIHRRTQLDSVTGTRLTQDRLERCLREPVERLRGRTVLEAACGAGRFTEQFVGAGALVHAFDLSQAVDANRANIGDRPNYAIAQASVYEIPYPPASFDYVVALGMVQHTPDPERTIEHLYAMVRPGGRLVLDHYRWNLKYFFRTVPWVRLVLKRLDVVTAKQACAALTRAFFPLHWALRNQPFAAKVLRAISPCAMPDSAALPMLEQLGRDQAYDWLVLDTYDALTDTYKHLRTPEQIRRTLERLGAVNIEIGIGGNGVEASCTKPAAAH